MRAIRDLTNGIFHQHKLFTSEVPYEYYTVI